MQTVDKSVQQGKMSAERDYEYRQLIYRVTNSEIEWQECYQNKFHPIIVESPEEITTILHTWGAEGWEYLRRAQAILDDTQRLEVWYFRREKNPN
jgi:hypothetical protein